MPSAAHANWKGAGLARLRELEKVHTQVAGGTPGRKWGTEQLNRSLMVALVAQFQTYCRELHDEAVAVHVGQATAEQQSLLEQLLTTGRKLDTHTPRTDTLGSDFGRLGFDLMAGVKAVGAVPEAALKSLDLLVEFRNAVGHGNEAKIAKLEKHGPIKATKKSYTEYRATIDGLVGTIDAVVAAKLAALLNIGPPW